MISKDDLKASLSQKAKEAVEEKKTDAPQYVTTPERLRALGEAMSPNQEKFFATVFSELAGKRFPKETDLNTIIDAGIKKFVKGKHSPDMWEEFSNILKSLTQAGVKWNKKSLTPAAKITLGIK